MATSPIADDYYYRRAEAELKMAQATTVPAAAKAHYELANHYLDRFYGAASQPGPRQRS